MNNNLIKNPPRQYRTLATSTDPQVIEKAAQARIVQWDASVTKDTENIYDWLISEFKPLPDQSLKECYWNRLKEDLHLFERIPILLRSVDPFLCLCAVKASATNIRYVPREIVSKDNEYSFYTRLPDQWKKLLSVEEIVKLHSGNSIQVSLPTSGNTDKKEMATLSYDKLKGVLHLSTDKPMKSSQDKICRQRL